MPMKPGLKLMVTTSANGLDTERELIDEMVNELNRTILVVSSIAVY